VSGEVSRRAVLSGIAASGLLALVPRDRLLEATARGLAPGRAGRFLDAREMTTLRAVTDRLLPGRPEDPDPGALDAHCAEAIDALLGAFTFDPPLIHAGGPFSDRAGGRGNDMARFVPLDALTELGWRIRLEGTQNKPERMFAGKVTGLQELYQDGLAEVDRRAKPDADFASAAKPAQNRILADPKVADFTAAVVSDCISAMYGPPEYLGNHKRSGWKSIRWTGDTQPRGWTDRQVSSLDPHRPPAMTAAAGRNALSRFIPGTEDIR